METIDLGNGKTKDISYWDNGQIQSEINKKYGTVDGKTIYWYQNGQKSYEYTHHKTGRFREKLTEWYENGQISIVYDIVDGTKDGQCISYYENGQKRTELCIVDGLVEGQYTLYYENGQKSIECSFKNSILTGKLIEWHENGQKFHECSYKNGHYFEEWIEQGVLDGERDGIWTWWHENGVMAQQAKFENNRGIYKTEWDKDGNQIAQLNEEQILKEEESEREIAEQINPQFNPIENSNVPLTDDEKLLGTDFWSDIYGDDFIK
jgi:antitoxin component YwqK of YwqJK toxin-antitoxin module